MRRIVALMVSLFLLLYPFSLITIAADSKEPEEKTRDEIISVFADVSGIELTETSTVSVFDNYIRIDQMRADGVPEALYIIGIEKSGDNLKIINLDDFYTREQDRSSAQYQANYTNLSPLNEKIFMTVTFTITYSRYYGVSSIDIYRPSGLSAYWTPGDDALNITVSSFDMYYDTSGDLVVFPECNTSTNLASLVVTSNYSHTISINKTNPTATTVYSAYSSLPSNRAIWFSNAYFHGSNVAFDIYTSNGRFNDSVTIIY